MKQLFNSHISRIEKKSLKNRTKFLDLHASNADVLNVGISELFFGYLNLLFETNI